MTTVGPKQTLDAVNVAQLVSVSLRLAMELSVLRDRLRTHEALLEKHGLLKRGEVDAFAPDENEVQARRQLNQELIDALGGDILQPGVPQLRTGSR